MRQSNEGPSGRWLSRLTLTLWPFYTANAKILFLIIAIPIDSFSRSVRLNGSLQLKGEGEGRRGNNQGGGVHLFTFAANKLSLVHSINLRIKFLIFPPRPRPSPIPSQRCGYDHGCCLKQLQIFLDSFYRKFRISINKAALRGDLGEQKR